MIKTLLCFFISLLALPLTAANTATWFRSSAISPDGQTIVFSYKGDIYTVSTNGGTAHRLTSNAAYDGYPCWSPDGKHIAFSSDRFGSYDIFVVPVEGGSPKRLTTHSAHEYAICFLDNSHVLYSSYYMSTPKDIYFPGSFTQVYSVDLDAHRPELFSALTMEAISINKKGELLYHNKKGYEDEWRKHHHSPITRDLYLSQVKSEGRTYRKLTSDNVENRNAVWTPDGLGYYYLSEKSGTMNIYKVSSIGGTEKTITHYKDYPVRYLSIAQNGTLCFSWDGALYTLKDGGSPQKVNINIISDDLENFKQPMMVSSGASAFDVSKNEDEVTFTLNGDLYTTVMDYATTKRLTRTPEAEKNPCFSPDGRSIVYASERGGTWNIYQQKLVNSKDKKFTYATDIKEEALITGKDPFTLPKYSPDGKKIAFLANRTEIRVYDVKSKQIVIALPAKYNFSYTDGDMNFQWSPDSRWILTSYMGNDGWNNKDVIVVSADGKKLVNLTKSGYSDENPQWALGGKAIIWESDRAGYRSHGSWGAESDAYIMFLDKEAYQLAQLNKEDRGLYEQRMKEAADSTDKKKKDEPSKDKAANDNKKKTSKDKNKDKDKNKAKAEDTKPKADTVKALKLDFEDCEQRVMRLTANSSNLGTMYLTPDGKKLYYTASFEGGYDMWVHDLENNSTRILIKGFGGGNIIPDKKGENLFLCNGLLRKIALSNGAVTDIPFSAEREGQTAEQREYIFDHCVNQIKNRFCDVNYHGVDFVKLAEHYRNFLPSIGNSKELSEMVSELLGELNCSHTGLKYRPSRSCPTTAYLGAFFDASHKGDGLLIEEIVKDGPLDLANGKIAKGCIIEQIDHQKIEAGKDYFPLLAGKANKWVLLTVTKGKEKFETYVRPVQSGDIVSLLYNRWVKRCSDFVEKYSKGQIGYVHVQDMNSISFRKMYSEVLGKYRGCKALIVDERHNGGGWLHSDLGIFLSGKQFCVYSSRGQRIGVDPFTRWNRPSCVMVCENCYSNANGFPAMYKSLNLGKLVGTPMAGTMTAVWWEDQLDRSLKLGIPQIYCSDMDGNPLENQQLDPDVEVYNTPIEMLTGDDQQLKKAVDLMLQETK